MIQDTPEGNELIYRLIPLEILLQLLVAALFISRLWDSVSHQYLSYFMGVLGIVAIIRLVLVIIVRSSSESRAAGHGFLTKTLFLATNVLSGTCWGTGLLVLAWIAPEFSLINPIVPVIMAGVLLAAMVGSGLGSWLFIASAAPAFLPPLVWFAYVSNLDQIAVWGFLALISMIVFGIGFKLEATFSRYRQMSRQNTQILKQLASAKEQAIKDSNLAKEACESLETEVNVRKSAEEKIRATEKETARILQDMQDTFIRVDGKGIIRRLSPSIQFLVGRPPEKLIGEPFTTLFTNKKSHTEFMLEMQDKCGVLENYELKMHHTLGHGTWIAVNAHYSSGGIDFRKGFEGTMRDISESKKAAEDLFLEKNKLHVTLDSIGDGVITTNLTGIVEFLNPVAEKMTGWSEKEASGQPLTKVLRLLDENTQRLVALPLRKWLKDGIRAQLSNSVALQNLREKQKYAIELTGAPIRDSHGAVIGCVLVFRNVTKLRTLANQLSYQAAHDPLTGLINRREFETLAAQAIDSAGQEHKVHAMCFIDLDNFKIVNDTSGHPAGDELLKQISLLMHKQLRGSDSLARLGGDEFGVLLIGCPIESAQLIAEKIRAAVESFVFAWKGRTFKVGTSIGLSPITSETVGLTELLGSADAACYIAKKAGRNQVHTYKKDDNLIAKQSGQMQWVDRIKKALNTDQFILEFQTILDIQSTSPKQKLFGELLLRMIDDSGKSADQIIMPHSFIPAAERYQLMTKVDRWVISNTLQTLQGQKEKLAHWDACCINLSDQSVNDPQLLAFILETLNNTNVPAKHLCFEISEPGIITGVENATRLISTLSKIGCRFSIDRYGSGVSSLSFLKKVEIHFLKINGDLIKEITTDKASYAIVEAIHNVAKNLDIKTIATHIENDETLSAVKRIGLDYVQGYKIDLPTSFICPQMASNQRKAS